MGDGERDCCTSPPPSGSPPSVSLPAEPVHPPRVAPQHLGARENSSANRWASDEYSNFVAPKAGKGVRVTIPALGFGDVVRLDVKKK